MVRLPVHSTCTQGRGMSGGEDFPSGMDTGHMWRHDAVGPKDSVEGEVFGRRGNGTGGQEGLLLVAGELAEEARALRTWDVACTGGTVYCGWHAVVPSVHWSPHGSGAGVSCFVVYGDVYGDKCCFCCVAMRPVGCWLHQKSSLEARALRGFTTGCWQRVK